MYLKLKKCLAFGLITFFVMDDEVLLLILNISVAKTWRFQICMERKLLSFSERFSNVDALPLYMKSSFLEFVIFLSFVGPWYIHMPFDRE